MKKNEGYQNNSNNHKKEHKLNYTDGYYSLEKNSSIDLFATKDVITLPPTTTIMGAIKTMTQKGFRRVPIADAGTKRLEGIITSMDIVNFLGGGEKYLLVENLYKNNLLAAINADVSEIMYKDVSYLTSKATVEDALELMIEKKIGGIPIIDDDKRIYAIFTERDCLDIIAETTNYDTIKNYMITNIKTVQYDTTIATAAKLMVKKGFRRLPVVKDDILIGIVTASNIMNFLGSGKAFEKLVTGNFHEAFNEKISSLIKRDVVSGSPDMDLGDAAKLMIEKNVGSLPIIDNDILYGIITERDFVRAFYHLNKN